MRSHAVRAYNPLLRDYLFFFFFLFLQKRIGGLYRMQLYNNNNGYQEVTRDRNDIPPVSNVRHDARPTVRSIGRYVGRALNKAVQGFAHRVHRMHCDRIAAFVIFAKLSNSITKYERVANHQWSSYLWKNSYLPCRTSSTLVPPLCDVLGRHGRKEMRWMCPYCGLKSWYGSSLFAQNGEKKKKKKNSYISFLFFFFFLFRREQSRRK